jgi:hypothetical protein
MNQDSQEKQTKGSGRRLFQKGKSGNPAGRPVGSRNRATLAAEVKLAGEAEALTRKAIELALQGDTVALRLCLERIVPRRKSQAPALNLAAMERVEDLGAAIGSVLQEVAEGRLMLDEAATLMGMLEYRRRTMETIDLDQRMRALEAWTRPGAPNMGVL